MRRKKGVYLPDECKDDVRRARNGNRAGLFVLEGHRQKNLPGKTEDGQQYHQVTIVATGRQAEFVHCPGSQESLQNGEGSKWWHNHRKMETLDQMKSVLVNFGF